jgi:hypothetical protein
VGGGVTIEGGHGATRVNTTAPYDGDDADRKPDDGWVGAVNNGAPPPGRVITTFAVCASKGRYQYLADKTQLLTAENVTRAIACPAGTVVTGGGVAMTPKAAGAYISQTGPIDGADDGTIKSDGWFGAVSLSGPKDGSMRTVAICTVPDRMIFDYVEGIQLLTSPGFAIEHVVECDPGFSVTGGGVIHDGGYDISLHTSEPFDGADEGSTRDNGWLGKLSSPSGSHLMSAIAICSRPF